MSGIYLKVRLLSRTDKSGSGGHLWKAARSGLVGQSDHSEVRPSLLQSSDVVEKPALRERWDQTNSGLPLPGGPSWLRLVLSSR